MKAPGRSPEVCYALLRIVSGFLFACHGAQKIFGVLGGHTVAGDKLLTAAAWIELAGGILIALGLLAGPIAFIASGEMAVAYFKGHASRSLWPVVNGGELAVIFCFVFLYIAAHGSGAFSVSGSLGRGRSPS
jgi:putative oxidoreductase